MLLGSGFTGLLLLLRHQGVKFDHLVRRQERFDRFSERVADDFGFRPPILLGQCRVLAEFCHGRGLRFHGGLKLGLLRFSQAQLFSHSIEALFRGQPLFAGGSSSSVRCLGRYRRYGGHSANDQGDD